MFRKSMILLTSLSLMAVSIVGTGVNATVRAQTDDTAKPMPMFLLTINGTLAPKTLAEALAVHNQSAGDPNSIAAARSLGDLSHMVYLPMEKPTEGAGEVLFIDQWNSIEGLNNFFANPDVQKGADMLFSKRESTVWTPAEGFHTYHFPAPYGKNERFIAMVRGIIASRADAMALHNMIVEGGINSARLAGDLSHEVYFKLSAPGEADSLEFLAIDVWMDAAGMGAYYGNPEFQAGVLKLFTAPPAISIWVQTAGDWIEW